MSAHEAVPRSITRTFDLLEAVAEAGEATLTEAAKRSGLTPTTALRYLRALETRGYVHRDRDGSFSAGPEVFRVATMARDDGPYARLIMTAQPILDRLTERTGESSYLAVAAGPAAMYLATSESARSVRHVGWVGKTVPMAGTAVGEALSGEPGPRTRSGTVEPDITAVTHGVRDRDTVVAALSIIGPSHRMHGGAHDVAVDAITDAVAHLTAELRLVAAPEAAS